MKTLNDLDYKEITVMCQHDSNLNLKLQNEYEDSNVKRILEETINDRLNFIKTEEDRYSDYYCFSCIEELNATVKSERGFIIPVQVFSETGETVKELIEKELEIKRLEDAEEMKWATTDRNDFIKQALNDYESESGKIDCDNGEMKL